MALQRPLCNRMQELAFAQPERERLSRVIESNDGSARSLATDVLELHILQGYAVTAGSAYGHAAPSRSECFKLFTVVHDLRDNNTSAQLHKGGRAFTKHAIRASDGWWGVSTGTNHDKHATAEQAFERIWDNATWKNVFWLPHQVLAFEIRVQQGYGMRFQRSVSVPEWQFRGFVEPAVPDGQGHASRWRH